MKITVTKKETVLGSVKTLVFFLERKFPARMTVNISAANISKTPI